MPGAALGWKKKRPEGLAGAMDDVTQALANMIPPPLGGPMRVALNWNGEIATFLPMMKALTEAAWQSGLVAQIDPGLAADIQRLKDKLDHVSSEEDSAASALASVGSGIEGLATGEAGLFSAINDIPAAVTDGILGLVVAGTGGDVLTVGGALWLAARRAWARVYNDGVRSWRWPAFIVQVPDNAASDAGGFQGPWLVGVDPRQQGSEETDLEFVQRVAPGYTWAVDGASPPYAIYEAAEGSATMWYVPLSRGEVESPEAAYTYIGRYMVQGGADQADTDRTGGLLTGSGPVLLYSSTGEAPWYPALNPEVFMVRDSGGTDQQAIPLVLDIMAQYSEVPVVEEGE